MIRMYNGINLYNDMLHMLRIARKFNFSSGIVLQYKDLSEGKDLTEVIERAYGPTGEFALI